MDSPQFHTYVMAPLVKGAVAGAFASYYIGSVGKVPLLGMPVPPSVLIGSSVAGASLVAALSHDMILARIKGNKYVDLEGKALSMVLTAWWRHRCRWRLLPRPSRLQGYGRALRHRRRL
jgi:hypothetical protein